MAQISAALGEFFIIGLIIFIGIYVLLRILTHRKEHIDLDHEKKKQGKKGKKRREKKD